MHIHCLGINHRTADLALRERLAFTPERLGAALARLGCGGGNSLENIQELVVLSTCNRVEIYAVAPGNAFASLEQFLSETQQVPVREFAGSLYRLQNDEAIGHLLRVAAGLDSLVLGEPQILGQVAEAYSLARRHGTAGKIISRLFQTAIYAGKRTRTETAIRHNPGSIASVAVKLIEEVVPDLAAAQVAVLGAGEMAELAVEALRKRGVKQILVVNRTLEKASELAGRWQAESATLESLPDVLAWADILITSTGAPHTIIQPALVENVMVCREGRRQDRRQGRPLVIMDIAVPRDVDERVEDIPGVCLYDIDTLAQGLETSQARRKAEIPHIEAILAEEHHGFVNYLHTLDVVPIIVQMRQQADSIRQVELEKTMRRMADITPEMQAYMDTLTKAIVKKILHNPTIRLRAEANGPKASDYAEVARSLFGIE